MELWSSLGGGVLTGVLASLMGGPAFLLLVYLTIALGVLRAFLFALGIWFSDLLLLLLVLQGVQHLYQERQEYLEILFPVLLLVGGILIFLSSRRSVSRFSRSSRRYGRWMRKGWVLFIQGFLFNMLNPGALFLWVAGATATTRITMEWARYLFLGGMLAGVVVSDLLKILGSQILQRWLTPRTLRIVRAGLGILLTLLGAGMFLWGVLRKAGLLPG